ncbi:MAG: tRNA (adenosine(37)-N6)-dimethylallyltransferase MiaA [Myxococcota bacterium]
MSGARGDRVGAQSRERLLAIVGPTASGKTSVAMRVAESVGGEIVTCDSVQVYRRFEIGCAKAMEPERRRVPHHLIDLVDWDEPFDAQRYRELAVEVITEVRSREAVPILCGGAGLYLRALRFGLVDAPPSDAAIRQRLLAEEAEEPGSLYRRLREVDPATAERTEPANLVHVARALEIFEQTGRTASEMRGEHGFSHELVSMRVVALRWSDERLRRRIGQRSAEMIQRGLLAEVERLLGAGVSPDARPMRAVGYREACEVVRGEASSDGLGDRIAQATWSYARRQRTWLRREPDVEWVDVDSIAELDEVADRLIALR